MRSILTVISDEALLNRIKLIFNDSSIQYYYALAGDAVADIALENEIAVAIVEYTQPVISGEEICELIESINSQTQIILVFDDKDTTDVINIYNSLHISKLICKQHLVLEELPSLTDKCFHVYNREEEVSSLDDDLKELNDKYMKPMNEMSSLLNERLSGYASIINIFKKSIGFIYKSSDDVLKSVNAFVDRILNDFIQIYMVNEPDVDLYFARIMDNFNNPEEKKYFKFVNEDVDLDALHGETKYNLLFILDVITIGFDSFYHYYRGKVVVNNCNDKIEVNAIYEVRKDPKIEDAYGYILSSICNLLSSYSQETRFGEKNSLIQFKSAINTQD